MEMITPDARALWIWILVFFGGCMAYEPPSPTEIHTPKSVSTEMILDENALEFSAAQNKISLSYPDGNGQRQLHQCNNDSASISSVIQEYILKAGGKEKLKIFIKQNTDAPYNSYESIIKALTANKIYNYKLITTPD